ncbi:hypothetical protein IAE22_32305, partial [Bacillus sp. S34]|nr:hypothetical protein [Bacillus sp. S34]
VDAGFARWRTPVAWGGVGARLSDVFRAIAEIAEVDPNLAHVWRNHFSFIEDRVHAEGSPFDREIVARLGGGEFVGDGVHRQVLQVVEVRGAQRLLRPHGLSRIAHHAPIGRTQPCTDVHGLCNP